MSFLCHLYRNFYLWPLITFLLQLASPEIALETNLKIVKVTFVSVFIIIIVIIIIIIIIIIK